MKQTLYALAWVAAIGCTPSSSQLDPSALQIDLTSNAGHVVGQPEIELTLTTWSDLAALADAVDGNELFVTLDQSSLGIDAARTGYSGDHYVAAFGDPSIPIDPDVEPSSSITIMALQTTWSFDVANLKTNDLAAASPFVSGQANRVVWPSASDVDDASSTILWACVQVANGVPACLGNGANDPSIQIENDLIAIDVAANAGDPYTVWGARVVISPSSDAHPVAVVTVLGEVSGSFE